MLWLHLRQYTAKSKKTILKVEQGKDFNISSHSTWVLVDNMEV